MRWTGHVVPNGRGKVHREFEWGDLKERNILEVPVVDGRVILKWLSKRLNGGGPLVYIDLVQDRNRWRALVNTVTKFLVP